MAYLLLYLLFIGLPYSKCFTSVTTFYHFEGDIEVCSQVKKFYAINLVGCSFGNLKFSTCIVVPYFYHGNVIAEAFP